MKNRLYLTLITFFICRLASAQPTKFGTVTGTVTGISGKLQNVSVRVKNNSKATLTDESGKFILREVPLGSQTIVVSFLGYNGLEKSVNVIENQTTTLDFQLELANNALSEVVVNGTRKEGYLIKKTEALGIPLETVKAPVSLSIMSDELLEDLGARTLGSIITYIPGVSNADNGGSNRENFIVRGFPQTQIFINGLRQSIITEGIRAIETVERVQVLKGPSGVEASLTSPGGFVNIITKKPQDNFTAEAFVGGGDYNFFRIGGDVTGPLVEGKLNGRLITAYQKKQFWRNGQQDRPVLTVAPSLDWKITKNTSLLAEYEFSWQNDPLDRGILYLKDAGLKNNFLPRTWAFHGTNDELKTENHRLDLTLKHQFTNWLSGKIRYQRASQKASELAYRNADSEPGGSLYKPDGLSFSGNPVMDIYYSENGGQLKSETAQVELTAKFDMGKSKNTINIGGTLANNTSLFTDEDRNFFYGNYANPFDIFNPNNKQSPTKLGELVYPNFEIGDGINSIFGQWVAEWIPRFRTVASLRYDAVTNFTREKIGGINANALQKLEESYAPDPISLYEDKYKDKLLSYRLGVSYDLTKNLTGFVGFASAKEPQPGFTRNNEPIKSITANSFDGGLKLQLFGGKALATASAYYLERKNISVADPTNTPQEFFLLPLGSAEIKGFEIELTGKLSKSLSVFGGLSVQDSKITKSDQNIIGNRFANVPKFQFSSFINYNAAPIKLKGLDVGLGIIHQGEREANSANQYQLPAYYRVDLALGYSFIKNFQLRFNMQNILDSTYYLSAQDSIFGTDQITVGDRRLFQFTLTKRW